MASDMAHRLQKGAKRELISSGIHLIYYFILCVLGYSFLSPLDLQPNIPNTAYSFIFELVPWFAGHY